jgi:cell division protein FtsW (lipid II flippase)
VRQEDPQFAKNTNFKRDMFNVLIGVIAQTLLVVMPLYLILHKNIPFIISTIILLICVFILKKNWWDHIKKEPNVNLK